MKNLWKSTIVIWSEFDPQTVEIADLARDATDGNSYCSSSTVELVKNPQKDKDWDGTEFFEGHGLYL